MVVQWVPTTMMLWPVPVTGRHGQIGRNCDRWLSPGVRDERGRRLIRGMTERVQHIPALSARGRGHRPDDSAVHRTSLPAKAAGDLPPHFLGAHALFRQVTGGRNPGIGRESRDGVPVVARTERQVMSRTAPRDRSSRP